MANGHNHHSAAGLSEGRLRLAVLLTFGFVAFEAVMGWRANSLALLSDAGHNFTDGFALVLSWFAIRVAKRPPNAAKTYGYHRAGILAACFNALTLLSIAFYIFVEAIEIFLHPQTVHSGPMIGVAAVAVILNTVIAVWLHGEAAHDVNIRSAYLHMMGDALSAAGVIVAGITIHFTRWTYADPIMSVVIGLFIVYSSWGILTETVHVLLEGTPKGLDVEGMTKEILAIPGVLDVHDLHVWTIADSINALTCHLRVAAEDASRTARIVQEVKTMLAAQYAVGHATIETECDGCPPGLLCALTAPAHTDCCHH